MKTQISYLIDRPDFIPAIAAGTQEEWSSVWPDRTLEWRVKRLHTHMNRDTLPIAWVMHDQDTLLGTAALRATDFKGFEHLTPWLGGVFVSPAFRGHGLGAALCSAVECEAASRGVSTLYLATFEQREWYASMGWMEMESVVAQHRPCYVMSKAITLQF